MPNTQPRKPARRWTILVSRGQDDLYEHLLQAFEGDKEVEVVRDRRVDGQRNPAGVVDRLQAHGVAVIRKHA